MTDIRLEFTVNETKRVIETDPCRTLLQVLRDDLGLTSVKEGCGQGDCGSCVVVMDGLAVNSCLVLAGQASGAHILTLEGLNQGEGLHPSPWFSPSKVKIWAQRIFDPTELCSCQDDNPT